ncbi:MAG TPA: hypothetical protein VL337_14260 [Acidimicrobiales bacterium]|nr:hypothetical protein [Acidimicrobiales bacterium]
MSTANPPAAAWLPPALRAGPDEDAGAPRLIDDLLAAVDRQRALLAADIDQLWQDLFIESCADWAVPYIGALLGAPADAGRLEVAYAIALRRRKGTPAALEDFAEVVTGWTARAIEGWQVTAWAQRLGHPPPPRPATLDLRAAATQRVGTPFERARRSVSPGGRWSPRAATAMVWPWRVATLRQVEAAPLPVPGSHRFALHPLAHEAPLYVRPQPRRIASDADARSGVSSRTGTETDAPVRCTYRVLEALAAPGEITYGGTWEVAASHPLANPASGGPADPPVVRLTVAGAEVPWAQLRFGSLPPGVPAPFPPAPDEAVVDLARGHVELGAALAGAGTLRATWHRPVPGSLGALAHDAAVDPEARVVVTVNPALVPGPAVVHTLADAVTAANALVAAAGITAADSRPGRPDVEIRVDTSDRLAAPPAAALSFAAAVPRWRIVAPAPSLPVVVGDLVLDLAGACVTVEGLTLTGDLRLGKGLHGVTLRGVTMDASAGATLTADPEAWSLALDAERCLLGAIRADLAAAPIDLAACVVDALGHALRVCGGPAGGSPRAAVAANVRLGPQVQAAGVTFVGAVRVEALDALDSVFADGAAVVQQQEGCLRHCYLGPDPDPEPSLPPLYRCRRDPAPTFASTGFEAAGYYTLALEPDHPLLSAASDGGEVGAYNADRRALRLARLRRRISEFVPLGLRALVALAPWEE